jgi:hypothetical protein
MGSAHGFADSLSFWVSPISLFGWVQLSVLLRGEGGRRIEKLEKEERQEEEIREKKSNNIIRAFVKSSKRRNHQNQKRNLKKSLQQTLYCYSKSVECQTPSSLQPS